MPAFFDMIGRGLETAAHGIAAGVQLGLNEDANRNMKHAADKCGEHATKVGLDVGGFATNTVAPALQTAGHAVATGACAVADVATLGQVKELGDARDHQARMVQHSAQNVEAGWAHAISQKEPWFRQGPSYKGDWMARLPDDRLVTDLFLPGTHDSGAMHGGDFAECQGWSIDDQLKAGIRCFDIRLRQIGDALAVHHGVVFQHAFFPTIAHSLENFLAEHPSEVLFVSITGNGCHHDSKRRFGEHVLSQIPTPKMWNKLGLDLGAMPLGEVRGCIVGFMCEFNDTSIDTQNDWEIGDADRKWAKAWKHARKDREEDALYVNFLSSVGQDGMAVMTPAGVAYRVNRKAHDNMDGFKPGIVMMDFPGMGIITRIIQRNF